MNEPTKPNRTLAAPRLGTPEYVEAGPGEPQRPVDLFMV